MKKTFELLDNSVKDLPIENTDLRLRRSGKTTRAVDNAIQTLFKEGKILIPYSSFSEDRLNALQRGTDSEISIVRDPDWSKGEAQKDFIGILRKRLCAEHHGKYEEEIKPYQYVLITLLSSHNSR